MVHLSSNLFFIIYALYSINYLILCSRKNNTPLISRNISSNETIVNSVHHIIKTNISIPKNNSNSHSHFMKKNSLIKKNVSTLNSTRDVNPSNSKLANLGTNKRIHNENHSNINSIFNKTEIGSKMNNTPIHLVTQRINSRIEIHNNTINDKKLNTSKSPKKKKEDEKEKLFAREENSKLFIEHKKILSISSIEDEIKKISSSTDFRDCLELNHFNFKSFIEVFAVVVMISLIILLIQYLSDYTTKKKFYEMETRKYSLESNIKTNSNQFK